MKKTKIITTIGPASDSYEGMSRLFDAGSNIIRLNFSHGDYEEHGSRIDNVRRYMKENPNKVIGILLDTKGPEIRTGEFDGVVQLVKGTKVKIDLSMKDDEIGNNERFTVSYKDLAKDVNVGQSIMLDDGLIELLVSEISGDIVTCEVLNTETIKSKKGVNIPGADLKFDFLSEKDKSDLNFAVEQNVDFIAASFVRNAQDVIEMREWLKKCGNDKVKIISKIEARTSLDNIDEIIEVSDAIMVARGDLGIEIPVYDVPKWQKIIVSKSNKAGKPVITATQLLESMQTRPRPTRAEANDVFSAVWMGSDATMLSGESAAGAYPTEATKTMAIIAENTEELIDYNELLIKKIKESRNPDTTRNISAAAVEVSNAIGAKYIICATSSGKTASQISRYRPKSPIIAITPNSKVAGELTIYHSVIPFILELDGDNFLQKSITFLKENFDTKPGDKIVIVAGLPFGEGKTNSIRVETI